MKWIISLDGGKKYKQYEDKLRKSFNCEGVDGKSMEHIEKVELKAWGVTTLTDRANIYKHIRNVIKEENEAGNINNNNDEYNIEGVYGTPLI